MNTTTLANALKSVFGNNTTNNPESTSKIPYCNSDGLPEGLASMGNLASVLGGNLFGGLTTSMSSTLKDAPRGVWFVYSPEAFSDNPLGVDHCSILISARAKNNDGHRGLILIDVESVSDLKGIYVCYASAAWKKLV